ncbi:lipid-A-disaccharide synthase [Jiulongibacter sp. NS-SX5]|uniref:lipid-A-disaccharide synthase n=1 Tax=Jiulongibacter sp. NS-SX5 TaxID=3463854 RepID=UPI0040598958
MKFFMIAGEKSGDLHAGSLAFAINKRSPKAEIQGWGGEEMARSGVKILQDYKGLAFMGLDFLSSIGKIRKLFRTCKEQILDFKPDAIILVDYSGFNLRIARWAKRKGFKVHYYIAPKTWAWNSFRNRSIKKNVDQLLAILPFEEEYFSQRNIPVSYVGNPLVERIERFQPSEEFRKSLPQEFDRVVALLPGSRPKEVERIAEKMKVVARKFEDTLFVIAGVADLDSSFYASFGCIRNCEVVIDKTYDVLAMADAAIVASGTATLETALFNVPQIVVYQTSGITYWLAKKLINVKYISLVNLIMDEEVVSELVQDDFNTTNVYSGLHNLLEDTKIRENQLESYRELKRKLGSKKASEEAAKIILTN